MSIFDFIRSGDKLTAIIVILSRCFIVFCCMPIHELAHAIAADKLGDDTARLKGRISFSPLAHLDLIGTLMIFLFGIGYAKPVPVNPAKLKNPRRDMALISLAGPVSNLLMAFVYSFVYYALLRFDSGTSLAITSVEYFFYFAIQINVTLAVFNLLPIPPLDGSKIFESILPDKIYFKIMQYERYVMIGLMVLLFTGILSTPISLLSNVMFKLISIIPRLIFGV